MTARALPVRRRLLAALLLVAISLGEITFGPGPCDPPEHGRTTRTP